MQMVGIDKEKKQLIMVSGQFTLDTTSFILNLLNIGGFAKIYLLPHE